MKICHIGTHDIQGGAARAMYRLHQGLNALGYESQCYVRFKHSSDLNVVPYCPPRLPLHRTGDLIRWGRTQWDIRAYKDSRPKGLEVFSHDRTTIGKHIVKQLPTCDIINLHWVSRFVDLSALTPMILAKLPMVWTLHDMNPFTGGCHYANGCEQYKERCGACPQLGSQQPNDLSAQIWQRKQKALSKRTADNFHVVVPSRWLAQEAQNSSLFRRFPVHIIPYGIDTTQFRPITRSAAREVLNLPQSAKIVLFVAQNVSNRRKGFRLLCDALTNLRHDQNVLLLSIGASHADVDNAAHHLSLGTVQDDRLLAAAYSAADIFVIPSLEDNMPNTVLEAMACGTPVVGFDIGGIPDMVRPDETGLLAPKGDVAALRAAIETLLRSPERWAAMSANCRRVAAQEYALAIQARRYVALYEEILANN